MTFICILEYPCNKQIENYMKSALVLGAGGFIGSHMVRRLKSEGYKVRSADLKYPEFRCSSRRKGKKFLKHINR
jgi:hypothetical protein